MDWSDNKRSLIIAHRGFTQGHVENTLEAVEAAIRLGCDGIEVDLRMTRDGELVIFHDKTLQRLAGTEDVVEELTASGIRKIVLPRGARLPTLEELLDLVRERALLNLEIKTVRFWSSSVEKKLVQTLRSFRLSSSILVSSFHPFALRRLRKIAPDLKRGYLIADRYARTRYRPLLAKMIGPFSLNASLEMTTSEWVAAAHQAGMRIFVWTVNDPNDMRRLVEIGVDGIFSDRPDRLLSFLKRG